MTRARDIVSAAAIGLIAARALVAVLGLDAPRIPPPIVIHATLVEGETASR